MIQDKSSWGNFLERLLTAALLTSLILSYQVSYQKTSSKLKFSLAANQTTFLAQKLIR